MQHMVKMITTNGLVTLSEQGRYFLHPGPFHSAQCGRWRAGGGGRVLTDRWTGTALGRSWGWVRVGITDQRRDRSVGE